MKIIYLTFIYALISPFISLGQYTIDSLSTPRYSVAVDFNGDSILMVGGDDSNIADIFDIEAGFLNAVEYTASDGFESAKVLSNSDYSVFYDLVNVNLSIRDIFLFDKVNQSWSDARYFVPINEDVLFLLDNEIHSFPRSDRQNYSIFDLDTKIGRYIPSPFENREFTPVQTMDKVYCVGGATASLSPANLIYTYDKVSHTWSQDTIQVARRKPNVLIHEGKLIISGGSNDYSRTIEIVDLLDMSSQVVDLPFNNREGLLFAHGNTLILTCGDRHDALKIDLQTIEVGQPTILEPDGTFGLDDMKGAILDDKLVLAGDRFPRIHIYDFTEDSWSVIPLDKEKLNATVCTYKNKLFIIGGTADGVGPTKEILIFEDLASSTRPIEFENNSIAVYPNPTRDFITWNEQLNVLGFQIFDSKGTLVATGKNDGRFFVGSFDEGYYHIVFKTSNEIVYISRFLVTK